MSTLPERYNPDLKIVWDVTVQVGDLTRTYDISASSEWMAKHFARIRALEENPGAVVLFLKVERAAGW